MKPVVQRSHLTSKQLRIALHLTAEGFQVPDTALISKQKFSTYLAYVETLRKPHRGYTHG